MAPSNFQQLANFIWSVADLLRGPYRPPQYERVMLPLTVLRRFDAVLAPSKDAVLKRYAQLSSKGIPNIDAVLNSVLTQAGVIVTICDPACGTGGMLLAAVQHVHEAHGDVKRVWGKLCGQEKNLATSSIAWMNLFLQGIAVATAYRGRSMRQQRALPTAGSAPVSEAGHRARA